MTMLRRIALLISILSAIPASAAPKPPLVLAAASVQDALTAAVEIWTRQGHAKPILSFAASSALARQIGAGAPADLFLSADEQWMDALAAKRLIVPATRVSFLRNTLVVAVPAASRLRVTMTPPAALARALGAGPLAMADPDSVPAGIYGKQALTALGAWPVVAPHVVRAANVRAALALVERRAAPAGIVYATDARASKSVRVAATFPPASHPPITYPIARLTTWTSPEAEGFRRFLISPTGLAIFRRYGFTTR